MFLTDGLRKSTGRFTIDRRLAMIQDVCPQIKGITDLGVSDFGPEVTAPIPIVNEKQLRTLTTSISSLQQQEFVNVALIGNAGQAYPPNSLRFAATLLRPT